jgi:hypothetical protein
MNSEPLLRCPTLAMYATMLDAVPCSTAAQDKKVTHVQVHLDSDHAGVEV